MSTYEKPSLTDIGSVHQLTLASTIHKSAGSGDVIVINGTSINVPGGDVINVS